MAPIAIPLAVPVPGQTLLLATAGLATPSVGTPVATTGLGPTGLSVGLLFAMILTQQADETGGTEANGNASSIPAEPKAPDLQEQSVAASMLPLLVSLNLQQPAPNGNSPEGTTAVPTQSSASIVTVEGVAAAAAGIQGTAALKEQLPLDTRQSPTAASLTQSSTPTAEPTVRLAAIFENLSKLADTPPPAGVSPDPATTAGSSPESGHAETPKSPIGANLFSTVASTIVQHAATKPQPSTDSPILAVSTSGQPDGAKTAEHAPSLVMRSFPAEAVVQKQDDQRDAQPFRQDGMVTQAFVEHAATGTERIAAELIAPAPSQSHPSDATAPAVQVLPTAPDPAPVSGPPRETLHLQLEPSDLGRVTMQVSVQAQQVQATVGVEHHGLGEFLNANQGALNDALRQHGLRIEEFHVETIANADVWLDAGRSGLFDQRAPQHDAAQFQRPDVRETFTQIPLGDLSANDIAQQVASRYRINVFA